MSDNNKLILIVDDVPRNLQVLATILYDVGYEIAIAENGKTALEILHTISPDLILLDIMMPDVDGFEVCRQIKSNPELTSIPIIFLTAKNDTDSIVRSFEIGASDYVTKPFNAIELKARVKTHLQLREKTKRLEQVNQELDQIVKDRTVELQKANQKLSQLDVAKSNLLGLISHELYTPISQIKSSVNLLKFTLENDDDIELLNFIDDASKWLEKFAGLSTMITNLQLNRANAIFEKTSPTSIIEEAIFNLNDRIKEHKTSIIREYNCNFIEIYLDKFHSVKSIELILDNAAKYSGNNGIVKIITSTDNNHYCIDIIDTGAGFKQEYLNNQFEFFTSDNLLNHTKGLGLSLAAAKLMIELNNGKLILANNDDGGAKVSIIFNL